MARFPKREADIRTLVQNIIAGLTGNPDFPNPPFTPAQLQAFLDNVTALGWGGRAEPTPLQVPGQPRSFEAGRAG
ncbi:hypothetical protein [Candidatus Electronema sp. PJ]|uniref:hypothetical protein n=1 Tax=Candidatus Electronema sp. PJ TaxID=3401572 RepID=UPI003AA9BAB7